MNVFLHLKAFQLFLIFIVSALFTSSSILGRTIECLFVCIYIGWIYSIGTSMNELIPTNVRPRAAYFKASCLLVSLWIIVIIMIFGGYSIDQNNYRSYGYWLWVLLPLHLYLTFSLIYIIYFAAKMLTSVIDGEIADFSTSYKLFFAIWIYPIGLWFIQPVIQKILSRPPQPGT
ncbi:MAG: hypothetical protein JWP94_275 [Mucilaginibacter sp.]|jgi:hypothetical protein|nr:hypothetical protein [Mucilaginibacter sp.]